MFSRILLERLDSRYVVTERETFYGSDILLTPYAAHETIDAEALGAFIRKEYADAKVEPDEIDTGALILTGVAVRRSNARAIGELFARRPASWSRCPPATAWKPSWRPMAPARWRARSATNAR